MDLFTPMGAGLSGAGSDEESERTMTKSVASRQKIRKLVVVALLPGIVTFAGGCAMHWSGLAAMADEGRAVIRQGDLTAEPGAKLRAGEATLAHADKYDQLINRSTNPQYTAEAKRVQREEREAAALLMRTAAEEYVKQQNIEQARGVYKLILDSFDAKEYGPVRRSALSALNNLHSKTPL